MGNTATVPGTLEMVGMAAARIRFTNHGKMESARSSKWGGGLALSPVDAELVVG